MTIPIAKSGYGKADRRAPDRRAPKGFHRQTGLSLLEVIIATSILAVSVAILLQIIGNANRNATRANHRVTAQLLCQNKLNELVAGIEPLERVDRKLFEENPEWRYSIEVDDLKFARSKSITIKVFGPSHAAQSDSRVNPSLSSSRSTLPSDEPPVFRLQRILRQPLPNSEQRTDPE